MIKSLIRTLKHLISLKNIPLTVAVITAVIIVVLNLSSGALSDKIEKNMIVFLLGLLATNQLIERVSILPRLENTLTSTFSLLSQSRVLGLKGVYHTRFDIPEQEILDAILRGNQVDLLGVSQSEIIATKSFTQQFLQDVHDGRRRLRLLLLNPLSNEAIRREKEEGEANISSLISNWLTIVDQYLKVPPKKLGNIVRLYNHAPSCMIIRSDDTMYVVHYVHGASGNSPAQKLQNVSGGLFEIYLKHFERNWEHAQPFQGLKSE